MPAASKEAPERSLAIRAAHHTSGIAHRPFPLVT